MRTGSNFLPPEVVFVAHVSFGSEAFPWWRQKPEGGVLKWYRSSDICITRIWFSVNFYTDCQHVFNYDMRSVCFLERIVLTRLTKANKPNICRLTCSMCDRTKCSAHFKTDLLAKNNTHVMSGFDCHSQRHVCQRFVFGPLYIQYYETDLMKSQKLTFLRGVGTHRQRFNNVGLLRWIFHFTATKHTDNYARSHGE